MRLKEKLNALVPVEFGGMQEPLLTKCEILADEFAIGFADWCKQEYDVENTAYHNKWLDVDGTYVSTEELLEIYKEKGL